jgi:hypothetical protein
MAYIAFIAFIATVATVATVSSAASVASIASIASVASIASIASVASIPSTAFIASIIASIATITSGGNSAYTPLYKVNPHFTSNLTQPHFTLSDVNSTKISAVHLLTFLHKSSQVVFLTSCHERKIFAVCPNLGRKHFWTKI